MEPSLLVEGSEIHLQLLQPQVAGVGVFCDGNRVFLLQWVGNGFFLRRC